MSSLTSLSHVGRNGQDSLVCWIIPNGEEEVERKEAWYTTPGSPQHA
jgi:hypothetical protein